MDIKQLEAFVCVFETFSFSKAGEALHLTQPTISSRITALEQELKVKLIIRTTKETYPSEAGKLLYNYAKDILRLRDEAEKAIEHFSHTMQGSISIAASTIPGQYFLPRLIQSFHKKYHDIKFNINMVDSAEAVEHVAMRTAEIGFTGTLPLNPKCVAKEFACDRLVIITPNQPRFQKYQQTGFPLGQLLDETFLSRETGSGTRKETELFLREMGINPSELKIAVEVRSNESLKKMVSEGLGIAIMSNSACEDYCQFGKLLAFNLSSTLLHRKLYVIRHKSSMLSPIAQVFYDFAKDFYNKNDPKEP